MRTGLPRRIRCGVLSIGAACNLGLAAAASPPASASGCSFASQGEGRVDAVIDARTLRLQDGREVRLAGIETAGSSTAAGGRPSALAAMVAGREVTLRGDDDAPDRYGRQPAFVFLSGSDIPVQSMLLAQGDALVSAAAIDKECSSILMAAEAVARQARRGTWMDSVVIKNAESTGDILTRIGQFTVVEGRVLSVRQAGTTTYLNFGRNWTRDFAVTISKRSAPAFETAGMLLKSLENKRIRVRGWVEARRGPRIEVLQVGQIELLGEN